MRLGKGYRLNNGKIEKTPRALSVSERIRQRFSKNVKVKKPGLTD